MSNGVGFSGVSPLDKSVQNQRSVHSSDSSVRTLTDFEWAIISLLPFVLMGNSMPHHPLWSYFHQLVWRRDTDTIGHNRSSEARQSNMSWVRWRTAFLLRVIRVNLWQAGWALKIDGRWADNAHWSTLGLLYILGVYLTGGKAWISWRNTTRR